MYSPFSENITTIVNSSATNVSGEILQLKECLNKAVASQDFERAAALRDQIKALEGAASKKAVRATGNK